MTIAQLLPLVFSAGALVMSMMTFVRAGRWKETEAAQALHTRLTAAEKTLGEHGVKLADIPTKADLARVQSDVHALERTVASVDAGVIRIEQYLINAGSK